MLTSRAPTYTSSYSSFVVVEFQVVLYNHRSYNLAPPVVNGTSDSEHPRSILDLGAWIVLPMSTWTIYIIPSRTSKTPSTTLEVQVLPTQGPSHSVPLQGYYQNESEFNWNLLSELTSSTRGPRYHQELDIVLVGSKINTLLSPTKFRSQWERITSSSSW